MTPIDTDDLAPEKIGWLRAFENSKITDEEYQYIIADTPTPGTDDYKTYYDMTQAILPGGGTNE